MRYISTRGLETGLSFEQVLFSGYAKDGGIYFPESIPQLDSIVRESWSNLSYPELVKKIMPFFIDSSEMPVQDLNSLVDKAFEKFKIPEVVKIAELNDGLKIAELFHGPTLAFKDLALSIVGGLYNYFLKKSKRHMTILVGTSGDTGSAAIEAVRGLEMLDIVILLPKDRCTKIQRLQMTTVTDDNVHNFSVEGTSDDLDVPIKAVFSDPDYVQKHNLCSINSINWARILVQIVHYIYCYFRCRKESHGSVRIIVPTGACGNITAGYVAKMMGFPIELIAVVNPNDIVHRTFSNGDFSVASDVKSTWASAMDIQMPYNVERILLMAANLNAGRVAKIMAEFEKANSVKIPPDLLDIIKTVIIDTKAFDNSEIEETIARCSEKNGGYLVCPHTAVAVKYFYELKGKTDVPHVCIATASPAKFPDAILKSGLEPQETEEIRQLLQLPEKFAEMKTGQNWEAILRAKIEEISSKHRK